MAKRRVKKKRVVRKRRKARSQQALIISALRRVWLWSPERRAILSGAKSGSDGYVCESCGEIGNVQVDHIDPVGKFLDWNTFIERLFVPSYRLQALCKRCHLIKTNKEKEV